MIKQYRKKPVVVSAIQWDGSKQSGNEITVWTNGKAYFDSAGEKFCINTLEGEMKVSSGDFVICGVAGEFYSRKANIFEQTYEEVTEMSCEFEQGEMVILKPENKVYEFRYVGGTGMAVICIPGERNMQDSIAVKLDEIEKLPAEQPEAPKNCGCEAGQCKKCSKEFEYPVGPAFSGSSLSTSHRPYVCPVCNGAGTVSRPPHIAGDQTSWSSSSCPLYICHACCGTGVVWG